MVNISPSPELENKVIIYQCSIINEVQEYRHKNNLPDTKSRDNKDYPRVITGCEYTYFGTHIMETGRSESGKFGGPRSLPLNAKIWDGLHLFSPIANKPCTIVDQSAPPKRLFIGTCAEDDAATKVLDIIENQVIKMPSPSLKDLTFAQPRRVKTSEPVLPCKVCETLFG